MSLKLYRLASNDATIGGIAFEFPSGMGKSITWQHAGRITHTLEMAKKCVTELLTELQKQGAQREIDAMNIPSCIAAVRKHISDWNDTRPRTH